MTLQSSTGPATLITITHGGGESDYALSADVPVRALVDRVLVLKNVRLGGHVSDRARWHFRRADGSVLPSTQTLEDLGVQDGEVIALTRDGSEDVSGSATGTSRVHGRS